MQLKRWHNQLMWLPALWLAAPVYAGDRYDPTTLVFPTFLHTYGVRKATKFHLFLYVQNRVRVNNPQGIAATRLLSWEDPTTDKDDDEITVYGVNSGENVIIYNTSMTQIAIYGLNERGEKALHAPHGIAAAPWGDVYVADTGNNRVVHFFNPARQLTYVRSLRGDGMKAPVGVAFTEDSTLYVSDTGNSRILAFRGDSLVALLVKPGDASGRVRRPTGIAAIAASGSWNHFKADFFAVIDQNGRRLQTFRRDGTFEAAITADEFGYPNAWMQYVAIDYYGQIWVTDRANHCVHKFDRNLRYLASFGRKGTGDKEFIEPRGITIYRRFGQVLIAEKEAAQYYWIGTDLRDLRIYKDSQGMVVIDYVLTEPSYLTLEVASKGEGKRIPIFSQIQRPAGPNQERLNSAWQPVPYRIVEGEKVYEPQISTGSNSLPSGSFTFYFRISATYSSYRYFTKEVEKTVIF